MQLFQHILVTSNKAAASMVSKLDDRPRETLHGRGVERLFGSAIAKRAENRLESFMCLRQALPNHANAQLLFFRRQTPIWVRVGAGHSSI